MTTTTCDAEALLSSVRAYIAAELRVNEPTLPALGEITLYPHQQHAALRVLKLLRLAGGAMLADATGLGKTFVALAVARTFEHVLIVAPASLIDAWRHSTTRAGMVATFVSMERLSRGDYAATTRPNLVVVDEAHHFRNPSTKRYAAIAMLCDRAKVLLLSATPVQNRRDDLVAQLALFLGDGASAASDDGLARLIVRRRAAESALHLPVVRGPRCIELPVMDDLLDELLALPAPVPASNEGDAQALVTYSLLRQWSSSRAALVAALRRRLAKAVALVSSLETGRWPRREELIAWSCGADAIQLAFPEVVSSSGAAPEALSGMLEAVRGHGDAVRALLGRLQDSVNPDPARVMALERLRVAHPETRIIAFSQYTETVRELSRLLMARQPGIAELTARGGRVAGGRIRRKDILAQFAPKTLSAETADAERISMLVTTDVSSEGLDLQRASVVVHLDLPWNPARLEQRVGRVRRLGSAHDEVFVYTLAPPASSERVLRVDARLRAKLGVASRIVGLGASFAAATASIDAAPPEITSNILATIARWQRPEMPPVGWTGTRYAAVLAPNDGLLALVAVGEERLLLAQVDGRELSLDASMVRRAIALCDGPATVPSAMELAAVERALAEWCERWSARQRLVLHSPAGARARGRIGGRMTALLNDAPRHERAALSMVVSHARRALGLPLGAAAEAALAGLAEAPRIDAAWLSEVAAIVAHRASRAAALIPAPLAAILLRRRRPGD